MQIIKYFFLQIRYISNLTQNLIITKKKLVLHPGARINKFLGEPTLEQAT
jgi:hypothetical protein